MAKDSWYNRINPLNLFDGRNEVRRLQKKLDLVMEQFDDAIGFEAKFLDNDPAGSSSGMENGYGSIEQATDIAAVQRVYATEVWVYSAVTTIAETIAGLPIKLERSKKVPKIVTNDVTGKTETIESIVWTDASGEKLFDAFQYPNKFTTKTEFYTLLCIDLLTAGEYFICLEAKPGFNLATLDCGDDDNNVNTPFGRLRSILAATNPIKAMYRLPPSMMTAVPSEDKKSIAGYALTSDDGKKYAYSASEIVHVKLPNPMDPFRGLSPLFAAFKSVLLDRFTTEHMIRFYKSGMRLGGVIQTDKSLNREQLARFQRSLENNYTGRQNQHRTLILPPGMKYEAVEQNPAETALLEFCRYNRESILSVFKVPPVKLGLLEDASYANANAQLKTYYNDCIIPKLSTIEDGYNLKSALLPDSRALRFKFDTSGISELKEDQLVTAQTGSAMLGAGLSVNEVRKRVWKLNPVPGGDVVPAIEKAKAPANPLFGNTLSVVPDASKELNPEQVQPTDIKPTTGTLTERVTALVGQFVASGIPLDQAIPKAIAQAKLEGFTDVEEQKLSTTENSELIPIQVGTEPCKECHMNPCTCPPPKKTLVEYLKEALEQLDPQETPDPSFIQELIDIYNQQFNKDASNLRPENSAQLTPPDSSITTPENTQKPTFVISKDTHIEYWKSFITKTTPIIEKRTEEVQKFFRAYRDAILALVGLEQKSYGSIKSKISDDVDEITALEEIEDLIADYEKQIDAALMDAYKYGYNSTLVNFQFFPPNEKAKDWLSKYAAFSVKSISETTRDQLRSVLTEAFERGDSIGQVSQAIREKFAEIDQGRALTIARTETLSAISAARADKAEDWQEKFPDKKLSKQWVSAQDDRVRDSHENVDGQVVDLDAEFDNGLEYPRQKGAPAEEVINCRCDHIVFASEDEDLITKGFNPDQPRDDGGRWGEGGGGAKPTAAPSGGTPTNEGASSSEIGNHKISEDVKKGFVEYSKELDSIYEKMGPDNDPDNLSTEDTKRLHAATNKMVDIKEKFFEENGLKDQSGVIYSLNKRWVEDSNSTDSLAYRQLIAEVTGNDFSKEFKGSQPLTSKDLKEIGKYRKEMERVHGADNLKAVVRAEIAFNQAMYEHDHGKEGLTLYRGLRTNPPPTIKPTTNGTIKTGTASSWSSEVNVAKEFANLASSKQPVILSKKVPSKDVIFYHKANPSASRSALGLREREVVIKSDANAISGVKVTSANKKADSTIEVLDDYSTDFAQHMRVPNDSIPLEEIPANEQE